MTSLLKYNLHALNFILSSVPGFANVRKHYRNQAKEYSHQPTEFPRVFAVNPSPTFAPHTHALWSLSSFAFPRMSYKRDHIANSFLSLISFP